VAPPDECRSCATKLALSLEEEQILRQMRAVREEHRALEAGDPRRPELRRRFRELKEALGRANREKLLRLGHEP